MNCPECGATDTLCKDRFDEFLVLEFSDMGYGAVHNLTVATYMLQHSSKLTHEGWFYERDLLREFLVEKKSPSLIRQQIKDACGQRQTQIQDSNRKMDYQLSTKPRGRRRFWMSARRMRKFIVRM